MAGEPFHEQVGSRNRLIVFAENILLTVGRPETLAALTMRLLFLRIRNEERTSISLTVEKKGGRKEQGFVSRKKTFCFR